MPTCVLYVTVCIVRVLRECVVVCRSVCVSVYLRVLCVAVCVVRVSREYVVVCVCVEVYAYVCTVYVKCKVWGDYGCDVSKLRV